MTIEDNFYGNLQKLEQHYDAVNNIQIVDTTENHLILAEITDGEITFAVPYHHLPKWFTTYLPMFTRKIKAKEV